MKNNILAVTGTTGAGKDFLVSRANNKHKLKTINLGTIIGQLLQTDRDSMMSTVDPAAIREAQLTAYRQVAATKQPIIVTCHAIREYGSNYTYDWEMEQIFNPRFYVFVAAPPEVIAKRVAARNRSHERHSPELSVAAIARIQDQQLAAMKTLTTRLDCPLHILINTEDRTTQNLNILKELIEKLH